VEKKTISHGLLTIDQRKIIQPLSLDGGKERLIKPRSLDRGKERNQPRS